MKFEVHRDDMRTLLAHVTRVIERNQTREILSNAVVSIGADKKLRIGCTDLETTMTADMQLSNVEEIGEVTIPGLRLFEIFGTIASGSNVEIFTQENSVTIRCGGKNFILATLPPEQLRNTILNPNITGDSENADERKLQLPLKMFKRLLSKASFAMGVKALRAYLNGTMFEINEHHFRMVATNGVVMAICTDENSKQPGDEQQIIVPRKAVVELENLLGDDRIPTHEEEKGEELVELIMTEKVLTVHRGPLQLVTNLINSRFPQYQQVVPEDTPNGFKCKTSELLDAIRSAVICATPNNHAVKFTAKEGVLELNASNERGDTAGISIPVESGSSELLFTVDGSNFEAMMQRVDAESISVHVPDNSSNLKIVGEGAEHYCYVVSRMRM